MTQPPPDDPFAPPGQPPVDPWYLRDQPAPPPAWGQPAWGPPAWGQPAYPYAAGPSTNTLAIVALVLSFFCFPVAVVLAIIALTQIRRDHQGGKGLAIAALAVSGLAAVALVGLFALGARGAFDNWDTGSASRTVTSAASTTVGTCTAVLGSSDHAVVDCSQPHDEEVYYVAALDDGDFPGTDEVSLEADSLCSLHFRSYVGRAYNDSELDYDYYVPDDTEWYAGEHRAVCVIVTEGATTSARASGR